MAKARRTQAPPLDRRARRDAQRAERRAERRSGGVPPGVRGRLSPVVLMTIGALVVGVVVIVLVAFQGAPAAAIVAPAPSVAVPAALAHDRTIGQADAPLTLEVWSDFQCPACHAFWTLVAPRLVTDYIAPGKAKLVYRDYAFLGPESFDAAVAARCANQQGPTDFWRYHDYLYANQGAENSGAFSRDRLEAIAAAMGLDGPSFATCLGDASVRQAVTAETAQGQALGVKGTPTVFLGDRQLASFDYATIAKALDATLGVSPSPGTSASTPPATVSPAVSP